MKIKILQDRNAFIIAESHMVKIHFSFYMFQRYGIFFVLYVYRMVDGIKYLL